MQPSGIHFPPVAPWFFLALAALLAVAVALIEFGVITYAYEKIGINRRYVFGLLLLCLLGSYVNIPIAELREKPTEWEVYEGPMGMRYVMPATPPATTILAVNLGGALIPTGLSIYLMSKNRLFAEALLGVVVVALVVHWMAQPVQGKGILVPIYIPPIVAALVALLLDRQSAAPLAFICGTLGTLIGADIMNLGQIAQLGAPVASIGGAGTFDGVFLTGIIAVLLA